MFEREVRRMHFFALECVYVRFGGLMVNVHWGRNKMDGMWKYRVSNIVPVVLDGSH